ncbi:MAG: 3-oxoacyl-ACP synthase III [Planctomycetota bacterium]|nr:MAG: 3-oxoacyl-ACP synthase III [Planctomycetota bacterium]
MRYENVCVESFAYELPDTIITSQSLEEKLAPVYEKLKLPFGRFEMMTGIRERRCWDEGTRPSQVSAKAAEKAIADSGIDKEDIECLLHTSVSRDYLETATALIVHDSLNLPSTATTFDISNACIGYINGMVTLANMIELGQVKAGIVVGSESSRRITEATIHDILNDPDMTRDKIKPSFASLTLGSGAVATVMAHSSVSKSGHRLLGGAVRTASQHNDLCRIPNDTCYFDTECYPNMHADFEGILTNGLWLAADTWKAFQQELKWFNGDVDKVFSHQVSAIHQEMVFRTLSLDKSQGFATVQYLGNVGACSLPISTAIGIEEGHLKAGDRATMLGIGSGLSCIMLGLEW